MPAEPARLAPEPGLPSFPNRICQEPLTAAQRHALAANLWAQLSVLFAHGDEPSSLVNRVVEVVGRNLGNACAVVLHRDERAGPALAASWADHPNLDAPFAELLTRYFLGSGGAVAMDLISAGSALLVPRVGVATLPESDTSAAGWSHFRSLLATPVRTNQGLCGTLCVATACDGRELSEQDRDLVVAVAGQLAAATERLHKQVATDTQCRRLQALVDAVPAGLLLIEASPRQPVFANQAGCMLLGLPEGRELSLGEAQARTRLERADGTSYRATETPLARSLQSGEVCLADELVVAHSDGKRVPLLSSSAPVLDADGKVVAAAVVLQEITRRKQTDRLKRDLLSRVAHELKTPLTAIKGAAAVALNSPRPLQRDEIVELLTIVDEQADRLCGLVDDILEVSRIQDGLLRTQVTPTALKQVLQAAAERFRPAGWRHIIDMDIPADLPMALVDPHQLSDALSHLLQTLARLSSPEGRIHVTARLREAELIVQVAMHGRDAPVAELSTISDGFHPVGEAEVAPSPEVAVGLTIAKGIAKAHGGRLLTESADSGEGYRFSLTLPLVQEIQQPPAPQTHTPPRTKDRRTRVLVVDDSPAAAELMRRSLELAGFRAVVTGDPESVFRFIELEQPDVVLLDLILPGTNGFELLRQIREFSKVPVIVVSVKEDEEDKVRCFEIGADDYITKPFGLSEFLARIRALIRRGSIAAEPSPQLPFVLDDLVVDLNRRKVTVAEREVHLSPTEYKLLRELIAHAGQHLTHDQLLERVWGKEYVGAHELLRSFVRNLRKKLGEGASAPQFIQTEQGVGYYIRAPGP